MIKEKITSVKNHVYKHRVRYAIIGTAIPFLMYPQAENKAGFLDSLDPDKFKYRITGRELNA